jgi:hypothetical protein
MTPKRIANSARQLVASYLFSDCGTVAVPRTCYGSRTG